MILHSLLADTQFWAHNCKKQQGTVFGFEDEGAPAVNCIHKHRCPKSSPDNYRKRKTKFINWNPISLTGFALQADLHLTHTFKENNKFPVLVYNSNKMHKSQSLFNPLNPELYPICYLLALLAHHFLHVSRIRVKSLTLRLLISYIYIYIYIWSTYSWCF